MNNQKEWEWNPWRPTGMCRWPSLPCSAKIKNTWSYTSTPSYIFVVQCLVE